MQTLAEAEALGAELMAAQFPDMDLDDFRDLPYGQLSGKLADPKLIVDGRVIPRDLAEIFASGRQNDVSVLVGSNKEEGVTFLQRSSIRSAAEYEAYVRERMGSLADEFLRLYPSGTSLNDTDLANRIAASSNVTALGDELAWAMRHLALQQAEAGSSGYVYEFTRIPPATSTQTDAPASLHGPEVSYVFNNMGQFRDWTEGDRQLAAVMASYWINFADTGSPNGSHRWQDAELPHWPVYTGSDEFQVMEFGDRVGTNPIWQIVPEKLELFDQIYDSLVLN
jgi:para-nitrobenzyl esterase